MANTNAPFGLRPVRTKGSSSWNGAVNRYWAPSTYNTNLFVGDPVIINGDANDAEVIGQPPGTMPEVIIATAGDAAAITGVIVGFDNVTRESDLYGRAGTDRVILVSDDPNTIYEIRDDGTGTPTVDWVGWNANLIAGSGGNTVTGLSSWAIDGGGSDGPDADPSNQLFILRLSPALDNEMGDYAVWEVLVNQNTYNPFNGLGVA